jgi:putative transposase
MSFKPESLQRRSIRLKDYDYSQEGMYFITVCAQNHECLFGLIEDGVMKLNKLGKIVQDEWLKTSEIRSHIELDVFVVMPNHFHGIVLINDSCRGVSPYAPMMGDSPMGVYQYAPTNGCQGTDDKNKLRSPSQTIGAIIRGFKSSVTTQINTLRKTPFIPVWQRNYYEHIICDEDSYSKISDYIMGNPFNWEKDDYFIS